METGCTEDHPSIYDLLGRKNEEPPLLFHIVDQKKEEPSFFFVRHPSTYGHRLLSFTPRSGSSGRSSTLENGPKIVIGLQFDCAQDSQTGDKVSDARRCVSERTDCVGSDKYDVRRVSKHTVRRMRAYQRTRSAPCARVRCARNTRGRALCPPFLALLVYVAWYLTARALSAAWVAGQFSRPDS